MRADLTAPRYLTSTPRSRVHDTREYGRALVSRVNRWMIGGAIVVAGAITAVTAHSFHAHTAAATAQSASPASPASQSASGAAEPSVPNQASSGAGGGLQAPSQAPQPAAVAPSAPAPVVSGGS
ncbi:MAG: hypothetical protein ACLPZR_07710 [Solirubrobacteraceae bacterium]